MEAEVVLEARALVRHFKARGGGHVRAVDGVDLDLHRRTTHAIVGESGSGKTTLARLVTTLERPDRGTLNVLGRELTSLKGRELREHRSQVQMVFQEPAASLDPRLTARESVAEAWAARGLLRPNLRLEQAAAALERVGLPVDRMDRRPGQLSGGECQRVAIARATAREAAIIVLDEPVSSLDMSIRAQILSVLAQLQSELGMAYLLVSHDLSMVSQVASFISVMYLGRIVERGPVAQVLADPLHPYTQALVSAVAVPSRGPTGRRDRIVLKGDPPSPIEPPSGCRFRTRCWKAEPRCAEEAPALSSNLHTAACHFPGA